MNQRCWILIFALSATACFADTLQEILHDHATASGFKALEQVHSLRVAGRIAAGGMSGTSVTYFKAPNMYRNEVQLPLMSSIQACAGADCWTRDRSGTVTTLGEEMQAMTLTQLVIDRMSYVETTRFNGAVSLITDSRLVDERECAILRVVPTGGRAVELTIDRNTDLLYKASISTDFGKVTVEFGDYREVRGVQVPFRSLQTTEAALMQMIIEVDSIAVNPVLPDSLFVRQRDQTREWPLAADSIIIPFRLIRNHSYIDVEVPGLGIRQFIFDSGAGGVALDATLVDSLGLVSLGTIEAHGVGGADLAEVFTVDSLRVGEFWLDDLKAFAVDFSGLERAGMEPIDGVIGYDLIRRGIMTVDYPHNQLIFFRPETEPRIDWGAACPLHLDFQLPYIEGTINDSISGRFRLDTGSSSTLDLNAPFVVAHNLIDQDTSRYQQMSAHGVGGSVTGVVGVLPSLSVCNERLDSLTVSFSTAESGVFAGSTTAGNIGVGLLKRFRLTFDYGRERVYFARPEK